MEASLGRPSCLLRYQNKISGEIKWLDLEPSTPEEQRPLGSQGQTEQREEATVVGATGINCKLNARVCTNAAQPKTPAWKRLSGALSQGQDICWWGILRADIVVWPGRFTPNPRYRAGAGAGRRHSPDVILITLGIPDYQDFRAQDLRHLVPTWETQSQATPQSSSCGGFTRVWAV